MSTPAIRAGYIAAMASRANGRISGGMSGSAINRRGESPPNGFCIALNEPQPAPLTDLHDCACPCDRLERRNCPIDTYRALFEEPPCLPS